jgi:two-component sensor histidine kinase
MSVFSPNTSSIIGYVKKGQFMLAWRICLSLSIVSSILTIVFAITNPNALLPLISVVIIGVSLLLYLTKTLNVRPVFWICSAGGSVIINIAMNTILDFTHYVDFLWLTICILIAFIGLGKKEGYFLVFQSILGIVYFFFFTLNSHIEILQIKSMPELIADLVEVVFAFLIISYLLQQFIKLQQHSENELKIFNDNLEEQNNIILTKSKDNETLIKEIHHRVKNNLQIIISLLRMQSNEMKTSEGEAEFKAAINRIMAMSLIHQRLYANKEFSKIDLQSYIEELTNDLINTLSIYDNKIELIIDVKIIDINLNTIVPLGLLINELVSNSIKHGISESEQFEINIQIQKDSDTYRFNYSDTGNWKEPCKEKSSFGLELIDILTEQMNGEFNLTKDNGTHYTFILKDV